MKLTFLGTGTSTRVPQLNCTCPTCQSSDPHDKRMRASAVLQTPKANILIDCGPDFVEQILRYFNFNPLSAVVLTHSHYDHVGGIDDLRPYCKSEGFPIYCRKDVERDLRNRIPYCFREHPYPGVPKFVFRNFEFFSSFNIADIEVLPVEIVHSPLLPSIAGYRFGSSLGYITDALSVPKKSVAAMNGIKILVINALRHKPHGSHQTLTQALDIIAEIKPEKAYLIHMSHDMGKQAEIEPTLPDNVFFAYDGLTIEF